MSIRYDGVSRNELGVKMNEGAIIRNMIKRAGTTAAHTSVMMGQKASYVGTMINRTKSSPRSDVLANVADALGYDLILRDRSDGYEFLIPPGDNK